MRVGIIGSGGLACLLAKCLETETSHSFVVIAEEESSFTRAAALAVQVVDFDDQEALTYATAGLDIIVATQLKLNQVQLVAVAIAAGVKRYIPADFEGLPIACDINCVRDREREQLRRFLLEHAQSIESVYVVCGVLFEILHGGFSRLVDDSGTQTTQYPIDTESMVALLPKINSAPRVVCVTATQDLVRFIVRIIEQPDWPLEYRIFSEQISLPRLLTRIEAVKGRRFEELTEVDEAAMRDALITSIEEQDIDTQWKIHHLLSLAMGSVTYDDNHLSSMYPEVERVRFLDWLASAWSAG